MKSKLRGILPNFKENIIFLIFLIGAITNDFTVRALTVGNVLYWKPVVTSVAMILIVSLFTLFFSNKIRNLSYIILSIYFASLSGMNYIYYKYYNSFLSFSLFKQLSQVREVGDSVTKTLDFGILLFFIPTIILIISIRRLNKSNYFEKVDKKRNKMQILKPLLLGITLLSCVSLTLTSTDWSRISKQWNRPYLVEQLGIYSYSVADAIKNLSYTNISEYESEEAFDIFEDFIDDKIDTKETNEYTDIFKGKDVYVIHYESAQAFAMDLEFEGKEVSPFLNKMASEGLFFNNFYPQHSVGTSSDSEFTFNTSLLPINNGTVFLTHFDREYVTLPKMLKDEGYYTFSMHGNNGDFWNRNVMHESLGYDEFFDKEDFVIDETIGLGLSDKSFFNQSIQKIKQIKETEDKPVMATLITLSNHYPFADVDNYGEFNVGHLEGTDIGNYFKSFHYADTALQTFIEGMDESGLLDNAVVVLYGDHHAKISTKDYEKVYNYDESTENYYDEDYEDYFDVSGINKKQLKRTPFIIWTKDKKINDVIDTPMGMVDALPTLSNMLGIYNPYQIGHDMLDIKENTVVFPNGDWLNDKSYFSASSSKVYDFNEDVANNEDDIDNEDVVNKQNEIDNMTTKAEDTIELSNSIIQHDLIRYFNGLLAQNKNVNQDFMIRIPKKPHI